MSLVDFLSSRREELKAQLRSIQHELREIDAVEAVLEHRLPHRPEVRSGTIKAVAFAVIRQSENGLSSREALVGVHAAGRRITRETLTPQLSRLKAEGLLSHVGGRWIATTPDQSVGVADDAALPLPIRLEAKSLPNLSDEGGET